MLADKKCWCISVGAERVTIDMVSEPVVAGSLVNITCRSSPSRPPVHVTWYSSLRNEATDTQNEAAGQTLSEPAKCLLYSILCRSVCLFSV